MYWVNLPKEYAVMMTQLYWVFGEKMLTVQKLCTQLKILYTTLKKANNWGDMGTVLNVQNFTPKKPFKGKCSTCGKQGHKSVHCWEKERIASKCPPGWNSSQKLNLAILVEDVMCAVMSDTEQQTGQSDMTKLI